MEQLHARGVTDILGYAVHHPLVRSLQEHPLAETLGDRPRDVLLLQLDRGEVLRGEYSRLARGLERSGFEVEAQAIPTDEHWWLSGNPSHALRTTRSVINVTSDWLRAKLLSS